MAREREFSQSSVRELPTTEQLSRELARVTKKNTFTQLLSSTVGALLVTSAIAVLVAVLLLPILRIYGNSMAPTLDEGSIVVSVKSSKFAAGDVIAFYYNNKVLVKRVVGGPGDWVNIDEDGTVFLNGQQLEEPYLAEKALGECDLDFPYQVPESRWFVLGDHRSVSVDSRSSAVGCVAEEQVVGKLVFCVWPFSRFGPI